eukprot:Unigene8733_Nuclearia_a/m.26726 Unigene8733_Nuclearia_a/g.26726  ORF Unigene8733_Nuclearia_a/g.26726 Unigene8733_Nuclearia_a/m.26726 type:complete len:347 (-) Unigene8733_Nuclearia_a:2961-4001(-)
MRRLHCRERDVGRLGRLERLFAARRDVQLLAQRHRKQRRENARRRAVAAQLHAQQCKAAGFLQALQHDQRRRVHVQVQDVQQRHACLLRRRVDHRQQQLHAQMSVQILNQHLAILNAAVNDQLQHFVPHRRLQPARLAGRRARWRRHNDPKVQVGTSARDVVRPWCRAAWRAKHCTRGLGPGCHQSAARLRLGRRRVGRDEEVDQQLQLGARWHVVQQAAREVNHGRQHLEREVVLLLEDEQQLRQPVRQPDRLDVERAVRVVVHEREQLNKQRALHGRLGASPDAPVQAQRLERLRVGDHAARRHAKRRLVRVADALEVRAAHVQHDRQHVFVDHALVRHQQARQ